MGERIEALQPTYLKRSHHQAEALDSDMKVAKMKGSYTEVIKWEEFDNKHKAAGHFKVELDHGGGTWYIFAKHWKLPWNNVVEVVPEVLPEWDQVNWRDFNASVSKYFTVGEVTNMSQERIPTATDIKKNIITIARKMDGIREWWGGPLGVNSWYRPWHVNARIGSRAPNHPNGYGIDFRPLNGSVWELQKRFQKEWYNTDKWSGGLGLGARKGFVHLDLRGKRIWNY